MKTRFILNKEESCFCPGAYGQRKCCFLMFVQNLEGIAISCFKIKAQTPNKGRNVGIRTPAGLCVSSQEGSGRDEVPLPLPGAHLLPQVCPLPLASSPWPGWRSQERVNCLKGLLPELSMGVPTDLGQGDFLQPGVTTRNGNGAPLPLGGTHLCAPRRMV